MTANDDTTQKSPIEVAIYITQDQLARRWQISPRTLERQRWIGEGPKYVKLGGAVRYLSTDVLEYERRRTVDPATKKEATP
jgi:predicted DNA-binding transcriptional regulator AlpA